MSYSSPSHQLYERTLALTIALYRVTDYFPKAEVLRNHLRSKANEVFEGVAEHGNGGSETDEKIELLIQRIQTIKGYLTIARTLNYVRSLNFTVLEKEYDLVEEFLHNEKAHFISQQISDDIKKLGRIQLEGSGSRSIEDGREQEVRGKEHFSVTGKPQGQHNSPHREETGSRGKTFYERNMGELNERQKVIMKHLENVGHAKISNFYSSFDAMSSKTIQRDLQNLVDRHILKKEGEKRWTVYSIKNK